VPDGLERAVGELASRQRGYATYAQLLALAGAFELPIKALVLNGASEG
jgi:hypothetical protein